MKALSIRAGSGALKQLQKEGLDEDKIAIIPAASGSAKWLALARLDAAILGHMFQRRTRPLHLIGSSIGAMRISYWARQDPIAALNTFEHIYVHATYGPEDTIQSITEKSLAMLDSILGDTGPDEILSDPVKRVHIMAVRGKGPTAISHPTLSIPGFALSFLANAIDRKTLKHFFHRTLFSDMRDEISFLPHLKQDLPTDVYALTAQNYKDVVMASGTIPRLIEPVMHIDGAGKGPFWDGGITDYHWDSPFIREDGQQREDLIFYPHFYETITPGWFDKHLKRIARNSPNHDRLLLLAPSADFVNSLPLGKIPERKDFIDLTSHERIQIWKHFLRETERLADEFLEVWQSNRWADLAQPLL